MTIATTAPIRGFTQQPNSTFATRLGPLALSHTTQQAKDHSSNGRIIAPPPSELCCVAVIDQNDVDYFECHIPAINSYHSSFVANVIRNK